jgi:hypothetical protein
MGCRVMHAMPVRSRWDRHGCAIRALLATSAHTHHLISNVLVAVVITVRVVKLSALRALRVKLALTLIKLWRIIAQTGGTVWVVKPSALHALQDMPVRMPQVIPLLSAPLAALLLGVRRHAKFVSRATTATAPFVA